MWFQLSRFQITVNWSRLFTISLYFMRISMSICSNRLMWGVDVGVDHQNPRPGLSLWNTYRIHTKRTGAHPSNLNHHHRPARTLHYRPSSTDTSLPCWKGCYWQRFELLQKSSCQRSSALRSQWSESYSRGFQVGWMCTSPLCVYSSKQSQSALNIRPRAKIDSRWGHVRGGSIIITFVHISSSAWICPPLCSPSNQIQKLMRLKHSPNDLCTVCT